MPQPSQRRAAWNWLPAFLAVAESGSTVRAGRELGLTPAAVSRTVRLLEEQLGQTLFLRVGRSLQLNSTGLRLRMSVRSAIDEVDLGFANLAVDPISGTLRVGSHGALLEHAVLPSLLEMRTEHASLVPEQWAMLPSETLELLRRGQLDVAFHDDVSGMKEEAGQLIGRLTFSIYCGRSHPLYGAMKIAWPTIADHAFCAPIQPDLCKSIDGWPGDCPRSIGMRVSLLHSAVRVGISGALLVALPDAAALEHTARGDLRRLPLDLPSRAVFAVATKATQKRASVIELVRRVEARLTTNPDR